MSTQLMQQEEDDGDLQSSATGRQPRPRRRRITYRLTLSLRVWRTRFSLIFAFSAGKLREPERQRPAMRVVGLQEAEPMMLMADGQTDGGDSTSGASGSITLATESMTKSEDNPRPVLGISATVETQ